jgi:hypothetical protein
LRKAANNIVQIFCRALFAVELGAELIAHATADRIDFGALQCRGEDVV